MIADRILQDLDHLWVELGRTPESEEGVLRAVSMTLVVLSPEDDDAAPIAGELAAIARREPNRAVVVRLERGRERFEHRVVADCWRPFGGRAQVVCSERIEIDAPADAPEALAPMLLALAAPDVPLVIWARSPAAVDVAEALAPVLLPSKMVVNSAEFGDPAAALERLLRHPCPPADLAWAAAAPSRDMAAQAACELETRPNEVCIRHAGERASTPELYLGAWLAHSLGARAAFERSAAPCVEFQAGGRTLAVADCVPPPDEAELLAAELAIEGCDRVFERTLPRAAELARAIGGRA